MNRYTLTEKWDDVWFSGLSIESKLVFLYLCDVVNHAGFLELNPKKIANATDIDLATVRDKCLPEISAERPSDEGEKKSVIIHKGWIWLPNFLRHQKNYPVNPRNRAHGQIIAQLQDQAIRFFSVPEYRKLKDEVDAAVKANQDGGFGLPTASREDLRRAPKDWDAVRQKCMSGLHPNYRHDNALRERFEAWWDHKMTLGDPLELPMWLELQSQAQGFMPAVIAEAISYAIANGMKTVNFAVANRMTDPAPAASVKAKDDLAEPDGWREAFTKAFDGAELPLSFWRIAKSRRKFLYEQDPGLEARVKQIEQS